jgi:hypothetical protein
MTVAAGSTISASDWLTEHDASAVHGGSKPLTLPNGTSGELTTQSVIFYRTDTKKTTVGDGSAAADIVEQGFDAEGACTFGDGGTTDYAQFDASGEFTGVGTARWTQEKWIPVAEMLDGSTPGLETTNGQLIGQALTIGDSHHGIVQLPPDLDASADITVKARWSINEAFATNSGEVQLNFLWSLNPFDESELATTPTDTGTVDPGDVNIPAVADRGATMNMGTIGNASISSGDLLAFQITRVAIDSGNNPTAEPVLYGIVLEYTGYRFGS